MAWNGMNYNAPNGDPSSIDVTGSPTLNSEQLRTFKYLKKALVTARQEQYFMPLATVEDMPKHFGKTIKVYEYIPLLDDRNINDQGLDASGAAIDIDYILHVPVDTWAEDSAGEATTKAAEINAVAGTSGLSATVDVDTVTIIVGGLTNGTVDFSDDQANAEAAALAIGHGASVTNTLGGNLYGSSKDIGTISGKIPVLREEGGRVNRVGFSRIVREGSIQKFGAFYEFTKETLDFDTDEELKDHLSTELMNGAVQITEAQLQMDLLAGAGVHYFAGAATSMDDMKISSSTPLAGDIVTYEDFGRLEQILTDNRTPTQTKIITGSRKIDTRVIKGGRIAYVGSEVVPLLKTMKDPFGNQAFIGAQHYADATTLLNGEIGAIDGFRFVQVPEMLHWASAGADSSGDDFGYRDEGGRWNVYPILVVGGDSFSTIGFQTNGKSVNFNVITKMPGSETAGYHDPYGETGFSSIKWWYGHLIKRPERIAVLYTLAPV